MNEAGIGVWAGEFVLTKSSIEMINNTNASSFLMQIDLHFVI
jgi:hypothetical protein